MNFCAKCGRQLMKGPGGEEPYCLNCGWRPGGINPDSVFEALSIDEIVGSARSKVESLRLKVVAHESDIADLRQEMAKWERLIKHVTPGAEPERQRRRGANHEGAPPVPEAQRWTCSKCGWKAKGRFPGRHAQFGDCIGAVNAAGVAS